MLKQTHLRKLHNDQMFIDLQGQLLQRRKYFDGMHKMHNMVQMPIDPIVNIKSSKNL